MNFCGNQKIANFLQSAFKNGHFSHAYCLIGQSQVGKRTLCKELAAKILDTEVEKLSYNPDFLYIERLEDEKTQKKKKEISVEQIRELKEKIFNSSWLSGYKVVILDEGELLNEESANAFLKILEEPPEKSIIFILTEDDNLLLPTIKSRCQCLEMAAVSSDEIFNFLNNLGCLEEQAREIVRMCWGRPGKAKELFESSEAYDQNFVEQNRLEKILESPLYTRWQMMEDVLGEKIGLVKTKEKLVPILDYWMMFFRDKMINDLPQSANYQFKIDKTNQIKKILNANVNMRLAIEDLLTII
jgi:DNA polymerase-3 subunit delta'